MGSFNFSWCILWKQTKKQNNKNLNVSCVLLEQIQSPPARFGCTSACWGAQSFLLRNTFWLPALPPIRCLLQPPSFLHGPALPVSIRSVEGQLTLLASCFSLKCTQKCAGSRGSAPLLPLYPLPLHLSGDLQLQQTQTVNARPKKGQAKWMQFEFWTGFLAMPFPEAVQAPSGLLLIADLKNVISSPDSQVKLAAL